MIDFSRITKDGKALFFAYDQGLEHGPTDFNDENVDPNYILSIGIEGKVSAVVFQKGVAEKYYDTSLHNSLPLIIKLNGKTNIVKDTEPYSPLLCTVDEAIELGAVAVGYTVYVGSEFESKMTEELAGIVRTAHEKNIPVIGWMYPRGRNVENPNDPKIIAYAARLGLELGADIVKIAYPGNKSSLAWAVEAAGKTKVVVSGGAKKSEKEFISTVKDIMEAGAIGMAVGRNVWQSKDPLGVVEDLKKVIFA